MTFNDIASHPFGTQIRIETLQQQFSMLTQWEDRYRQLILLGKQLPPLDDALRNDGIAISGCENRVWLGWQRRPDGTLHFYGDSDGRIVRGLLAVILTAVEGKTPEALRHNDVRDVLNQLGFSEQLSASRSAGLNALAEAVQRAATHL